MPSHKLESVAVCTCNPSSVPASLQRIADAYQEYVDEQYCYAGANSNIPRHVEDCQMLADVMRRVANEIEYKLAK